MAALSLRLVSPHAVNCPLLPSSAVPWLRATAMCCPAPCGRELGWGCSKVGCFFPCLSGFSLSKGSRCFWLLHPCQHTAPVAVLTILPAHTLWSGLSCSTWELPSNPFPSFPSQQLPAMYRFLRGKSLHHFLKQPFAATGLPAHRVQELKHEYQTLPK